jgi:hypothetical protein
VDGCAVHAAMAVVRIVAHGHEAGIDSARVLAGSIGAYHRVGSACISAALPLLVELPTLRSPARKRDGLLQKRALRPVLFITA